MRRADSGPVRTPARVASYARESLLEKGGARAESSRENILTKIDTTKTTLFRKPIRHEFLLFHDFLSPDNDQHGYPNLWIRDASFENLYAPSI